MRIKYQFTTVYNSRPEELCGMGKESLTIFGESNIEEFLFNLAANSSLKFIDAKYHIYGEEHPFEREEWKCWIGQPMFSIIDIKTEIIKDE